MRRFKCGVIVMVALCSMADDYNQQAGLSVIVEGVTAILGKESDETFLTQRGGKMYYQIT